MSATQTSIFDLLDQAAPPAPAAVIKQSEPVEITVGVHWILIGTQRARTACGMSMPAYYHKLGLGYSAAGQKLACTTNRDDGTITCPSCKETL